MKAPDWRALRHARRPAAAPDFDININQLDFDIDVRYPDFDMEVTTTTGAE